jgi:cyclohexanone monooxygenase
MPPMMERRRRFTKLFGFPRCWVDFIAKIDKWMKGTVWTMRCSNYFRAANGRLVTQWPRGVRALRGMTRRFTAADYTFDAPTAPAAIEVQAHTTASVSGRGFITAR